MNPPHSHPPPHPHRTPRPAPPSVWFLASATALPSGPAAAFGPISAGPLSTALLGPAEKKNKSIYPNNARDVYLYI